MLRHLLAATGLAVAGGSPAVLLAACGRQPRTGDSAAGFPAVNRAIAHNKINLRVLLAAELFRAAPFADLFAAFSRAYPNVDVDVFGASWDEIPERVRSAAQAGAPFDVAYHHAFAFGRAGLAERLDDLWRPWGAQTRFFGAALDMGTWGGSRYGVPLDLDTVFTIYNPDLFRAVGAAVPTGTTSVADLQAQLLKFQGQPFKGVGLTRSPVTNYGVVRAFGGDLLNPQATKVTLNDPRSVAAVRWMSELAVRYQVGTDPAAAKPEEQPLRLFMKGQLALLFAGSAELREVRRGRIAVGTAELPKAGDGSTSGSVMGGGSLLIGKGSPNRLAAFELIKWCLARPHQLRMARELGRLPALADLYRDGSLGADDPLLKASVSQLERATPFKLEAFPEGLQAWSDAVAAAYAGTDPQKALDDAQAKLPPALK